MDALQIIAVGYTGSGEHHVAGGELIDREFLFDVGDAHFLGPLDLFVIARRQPALKFAADTAQSRRRQHAFRRAADAQQQIDAGFRLGGRDRRGDVAVADQADARARLTNFLNDRIMPRPRRE